MSRQKQAAPELPAEFVHTNEKRQLTHKQRKYVEFLLQGHRSYTAARMAGYSERSWGDAKRVIESPTVRAELQRRRSELYKDRLQTQEIINEYRTIASANLRDYIETDPENPNRFYIDVRNISREQWKAIKTLRYDPVGRAYIELEDRHKALEMLSKIFGLCDASHPAACTINVNSLDALIVEATTGTPARLSAYDQQAVQALDKIIEGKQLQAPVQAQVQVEPREQLQLQERT